MKTLKKIASGLGDILVILGILFTWQFGDEVSTEAGVEPQVGTLTEVTAYCPCKKCCGEYADGKTASGHRIKKGDRFCAADPDIPFGTEFIVPGYNGDRPMPVLDRGGKIKSNHIDVFFDSHDEALEWGVKWLKVTRIKTD